MMSVHPSSVPVTNGVSVVRLVAQSADVFVANSMSLGVVLKLITIPRQSQVRAVLANLPPAKDIYSFIPNLLVDLNPNGRINGYIGVGGGLAFTNLNYISAGGSEIDVNGSSFAYQGIFGVSARVSQRADLFFEYRYFATDDQNVEYLGEGLNNVKLVSNDFFAGIRIRRW